MGLEVVFVGASLGGVEGAWRGGIEGKRGGIGGTGDCSTGRGRVWTVW